MRVTIAVALVWIAARADAQPPAEQGSGAASRAAILFEEGRALAKAEKWAEACDRFAQSFELVDAVGTQLNLADCLARDGKLRRAWQLFEQAAQQSERAGTTLRTKFARDRAQVIAEQLAIIVVKIEEPTAPGLAVTVNDEPVSPAPIVRDLVQPGAVAVAARMPGRAAFVQTVRIRAGKSATVEVPALGSPTRRRRDYVYAASAFGVLGVASLTGAAVSSYRASTAADRALAGGSSLMVREEQEAAARHARLGVVFGVGGLALLGISSIVYLASPIERIKVNATASESGGQVVLLGTF